MTTTNLNGTRPPYPLIDALRAFAALLVVAYHVVYSGHWADFPSEGPLRLLRMGWIGVDCFFVISGFVITLSALKDYERDPTGFRRRFMARRLARIFPLYLLTSLLYVFLVQPGLLLLPAADQLTQVLSHLFFVHNLHVDTSGSINGPTWSIGLEMQFYVFVIIAVPWLARVSVLRLLVTLIVVAWSYRYAMTWVFVPRVAQVYPQVVYTTQLPGTIEEFGMGMALGLAVARGRGFLAERLAPNWLNFGLWSVSAIALSTVAWQTFWPRADYWYFIPMIVFWRTLLAAAFACWMGAVMTLPIAGFGIFRPLNYLGEISYGIYLWHMLVLITLSQLPTLLGGQMLVKALTGTILLAALSWHFFERPLLFRIRKKAAIGTVIPNAG